MRRSPFATRAADTAVATPSPAVEADLGEKRQSTAYPFTDIEKKWQQYWDENQTFRTPDNVDTSKPKYYVLDMFPYPRYTHEAVLRMLLIPVRPVCYTREFVCLYQRATQTAVTQRIRQQAKCGLSLGKTCYIAAGSRYSLLQPGLSNSRA
jgi:hypothetical protein